MTKQTKQMTIFPSKLHGPSRNFLLKVEDEVLEGVRNIAESKNVSASQVMRDALSEYLLLSKSDISEDADEPTMEVVRWWE
jgi:predicted transcriptional regulator